MLLKLTSTNPHFSYIIRKNPQNGLMLRKIRKGVGSGWFDIQNEESYHLFFTETGHEVSYRETQQMNFDYLNVTQFNYPLIPIHLIQQFLKSAMQVPEHDICGFENQLEISMIMLRREEYIHIFNKYFPQFKISGQEVAPRQYQLLITTKEPIGQLLHMTVVFCIFSAIINKIPLVLEKDMLKKYIDSINILNAPFFIRYLFVMYFLKDKRIFKELAPLLAKGLNETYTFAYGNTHMQRREFIKEHLTFDKAILDIGCGEGYYAFPFSEQIEPNDYYAIDIDETVLSQLAKKAQKRELKNIQIFSDITSFYQVYDGKLVNILLTEVIEHMPWIEAKALIKEILDKVHFDTFIITTPNKDFNQFYILDELKRHDDHKWEATWEEWTGWMQELLQQFAVDYQFYGVGDCVNDIYTSQAIVITSKKGTGEYGA